jgi:hypothetical protein
MRACYEDVFASNSSSTALESKSTPSWQFGIRIAGLRCGTSKLEMQMLRGLERVTVKAREKRKRKIEPLRRAALSAAIEHLCDRHGVLPSKDLPAK